MSTFVETVTVRRTVQVVALLAIVLSAAGPASPAPSNVEGLRERLRAVSLDEARAVVLRKVDIELGAASLHVEDGLLVPAERVAAQSAEMVLVGNAVFRLSTPDPVEAAQIEMFTGSTSVAEPITEAVLVVARDDVAERLLSGTAPESVDPSRLGRARDAFSAWRQGTERRVLRVESALLLDALGDAVEQGFFAAWCRSSRLGPFTYVQDPEDLEPVTLGHFVPRPLGDEERERLDREIRHEQRRGRLREFRVEDLGDFDTWYSASLASADGGRLPGGEGFEPERYLLDVTVTEDRERIEGRAVLELRAEAGGRVAVPLRLFPDLVVKSVRDGSGTDLAWLGEGERVIVFLTEPSKPGQSLVLEVTYGGPALKRLDFGVYVMRHTTDWHPHAGTLDRARYDVTVHWPQNLRMLGSGRRVDGGEQGGTRWERRVLDVPSLGFGFEVGDFQVTEAEAGKIPVAVGFLPRPYQSPKEIQADVLYTVREALALYEAQFGDYPYGSLAVAVIPRSFSQGIAGFVSLSQGLVTDRPGTDRRRLAELRRETLSHELAHQWWGNKLGWTGYRDLWLSEALAEYASDLFVRREGGAIAGHAEHLGARRRGHLGALARNGRVVASLGPITLGSRLDSSLSDEAYDAIVYQKGAMVLEMLARELGTQAFNAMLKALADRAANRSIDTAVFLKALEHMSGRSLAGFAEQWIYGTGIPIVFYDYRFEDPGNGKWTVEGTYRQIPSAHSACRLVRLEGRGYDVACDWHREMDAAASSFPVPFEVPSKDSEDAGLPDALIHGPPAHFPPGFSRFEPKRSGPGEPKGSAFVGLVPIAGESGTFRIAVGVEPKLLRLDRHGDTPAEFHSLVVMPKRSRRLLADALARMGNVEAAVAMYREALGSTVYGPPASSEASVAKSARFQGNVEDAGTHLGLAELELNREREAEAVAEMEAAESLLAGYDKDLYKVQRLLLRCRLELRQGQFEKVYDRMAGKVQLEFLQTESGSLADDIRREKFRTGFVLDGAGYAMLAIAAHETGHEEVCRRAREEAVLRGTDVSVLDSLHH